MKRGFWSNEHSRHSNEAIHADWYFRWRFWSVYVMRAAIRSRDLDSRARLKSRLVVLFALVCLWRAEASLSGLSQPSTAHSLLIYQSLSLLLSSANYSWAPAPAACLIWRCAGWLWCLYQHKRARDRVLIEQKGIMRLPTPGGGTFF